MTAAQTGAGGKFALLARRSIAALAAFAAAAAIFIALYGLVSWRLGPPPWEAAAQVSQTVLDRRGQLLRAFATRDGRWRLGASLDEVDKRYAAMLLALEDKRFHAHGGVDAKALSRAAWQAVRAGRIVSGASTVTMQLARLMDGAPAGSASAKIGQIVRAWQIEATLGKREILELYLKLAPFGGNIEGVRAASLAYFGKEPRRLAIHEAALLVALPQAPEARRPDRNPRAARAARDAVLDRAQKAGIITAGEADYAKRQPVPAARRAFPAFAAHLTERLARERPHEPLIRTTLDKDLQQHAEALAARQAAALGPKTSAALIAADYKTGEILAHAGSAGYFDEARQGSIDMTRAVRSPGSALKPFIYGLAFEDGHAHPQTLIEDRPVRFGTYAPENFDDRFHGTVSVAQALQFSLNIPAVKLLSAVSPARLAGRFRQAGIGASIPRNLTVALGGVGLTLEELTGLYAALARGGEAINLSALRDGPAPAESGRRLLTPLAAWYVTDILRNAPPPANASPGAIAFKTGTSYGYRDAWAAGYDGVYIVAAWAGRPDATPVPGMLGLTSAAPAVFDMFSKLGPTRAAFPEAPASAIHAATADLPPALRRFREPGDDARASAGEAPLRIAFPPQNAELELARDEGGAALPLAVKAEGGAMPLTWLIDGAPAAADAHRRQIFWTPSGPGFTQLTVIDAKGASQSVSVRLR